jgi:hypothetical protein
MGVKNLDGDHLAAACLLSGFSLSFYIGGNYLLKLQSNTTAYLSLFSFSLVSGFALYICLATLLWGLDLPVNTNALANGQIDKVYWHGPITILLAVASYLSLRGFRKEAIEIKQPTL